MLLRHEKTFNAVFRLSFQNKSNSLPDKFRDTLREQLQYLCLVIMDEYSMIKSDMLYQIDARLKEIKIVQMKFLVALLC